eukprot:scaffold127459_cov75-Phaeocystis_antarctica.AAC.1
MVTGSAAPVGLELGSGSGLGRGLAVGDGALARVIRVAACHLPREIELELKGPLDLAAVGNDRGVTLDLFDGAHLVRVRVRVRVSKTLDLFDGARLDLDALEIAAEVRQPDRAEPSCDLGRRPRADVALLVRVRVRVRVRARVGVGVKVRVRVRVRVEVRRASRSSYVPA